MRVMVVDDEADVQFLFEQRFRREVREGKIHFDYALSGEEALALLERDKEVILVLSDINMPGMNGLDLLKAVKERYSHLKVFMITAYGNADYQQRAFAYGCDGYLTKPLDFGMLKQKLLA